MDGSSQTKRSDDDSYYWVLSDECQFRDPRQSSINEIEKSAAAKCQYDFWVAKIIITNTVGSILMLEFLFNNNSTRTEQFVIFWFSSSLSVRNKNKPTGKTLGRLHAVVACE